MEDFKSFEQRTLVDYVNFYFFRVTEELVCSKLNYCNYLIITIYLFKLKQLIWDKMRIEG